jgi:hypothetical protein
MTGWWRWWGARLLVVGVVVALGACASEKERRPLFHDPETDSAGFSKVRIGDSWEGGSAADFLTAEERAALDRSGMAALRADLLDPEVTDLSEEEEAAEESSLDRAGKMSMSVLAVGLTLGAAIAPYFLF